MTITWVFFL
jgi:transposase InsO family protein